MTTSAMSFAVPLTCADCGPEDADLDWRVFVDGTVHVQASCPACRRWLKFVQQDAHVLALLPPRPTEPDQAGLW